MHYFQYIFNRVAIHYTTKAQKITSKEYLLRLSQNKSLTRLIMGDMKIYF